MQKEVYEESRCYPLCSSSTCFLFMFSLVSYSSISLLVFMLTLIFIYCILTFFFFVYHFSCYIFVSFFFTCFLFFIVVQIFFSLAKFSFLLHLLKCLCPQNFSSLLNFVSAKHVIILLHCVFIHHNCDVLASFLFIFIILSFFPIVVQVSFTINTCAFFSGGRPEASKRNLKFQSATWSQAFYVLHFQTSQK